MNALMWLIVQGQKSLPARSGSYIPPRTMSKGKSNVAQTNLTANAAANAPTANAQK